MDFPIRINKYLRDMGLASRREADGLVEAGQVFINGKRAESGQMVQVGDRVDLKGSTKELKYLAYYKPCGLPTQDLPGRKSVITEFKKQGLYPVGRLDKDSEGLLVLTNDGRLAREMLSEKEKYEKEYVVRVRENLQPNVAKIFSEGMDTKAFGRLLPAPSKIMGKNTIQIILRQGKRHQIRVMMDELGYTIEALKRVRIGNIKIEDLKPGETRKITI